MNLDLNVPSKELLERVKKEMTAKEVEVLLEFKKQYPGKKMGQFGWAFAFARSKVAGK